jgi:hypothetical protein
MAIKFSASCSWPLFRPVAEDVNGLSIELLADSRADLLPPKLRQAAIRPLQDLEGGKGCAPLRGPSFLVVQGCCDETDLSLSMSAPNANASCCNGNDDCGAGSNPFGPDGSFTHRHIL